MNLSFRSFAVGCSLILLAWLAAGCELSSLPQATPTLQITPEPLTLTPSVEAPTPTDPTLPTVSPRPQLATATLTPTPSEPTATLTPSATPGPLAYVIQPGDTFYFILLNPPFNYSGAQINTLIPEFLRLNPGIRSIDQLPSPGSTIFIPLLPPTPTPENFDQTQTAQPAIAEVSLPEDAEMTTCVIEENDSILRCVQEFETTLSIVATLNPQLGFFGCNFDIPSGGPECNVLLRVGEQVNVPAPTSTPTLSPTPSGSETPTPTPTHEAPLLVFPPQNGAAPARTFQLQWISVGVLGSSEVYFVEIQDMTAGTQYQDVTRSTYYLLPDALVPADGQTHQIQWRVSVAARTPEGTYVIVGAEGAWRTYSWQSR
ncbi:MAG: hypothetical protein SF162_04440 [bacterium]|nr:hypothetical protein [bacterium]